MFFEDLEFVIPEKVYEPREDSYLAAEFLSGQNLKGKKLLDTGTGSGFLAVIAAEKGAEVEAVDVNPESVNAAEENAERNGVRIDVKKSDLFQNVEGKFDKIFFNAPYLPEDIEEEDMEQRSWAGGEKGRDVIERFVEQAGEYLEERGQVLIVQSSLTGEQETLEKLEGEDFISEVVAREKVPWEEIILVKAYKI